MALTAFPRGLSSFGAPVIPGGGVHLPANGKTHIWVHGNEGNNGNDGLSPDKPLLTMAKAFERVQSGGVIHLVGNVKENLSTPVGIFDVTVIGEGNRPRHADAHTSNNGYQAANWRTATGVNDTPNVIVRQQGWRFINILFVGGTGAGADIIRIFRDAGAGDAERDGGHLEVIGCRFASGYNGISDTGGCVNVLIQGCRFEALTNFCILGVGNIGVGQSDWLIVDNTFDGFTNGIKIAAFGCRIQNNTFTDGGTPNTTVVLNTSNGGGSDNFIVGNFFQTATLNFNTPDVVGNATDVWAVNASIDSTLAGVGGSYEWGQPA